MFTSSDLKVLGVGDLIKAVICLVVFALIVGMGLASIALWILKGLEYVG